MPTRYFLLLWLAGFLLPSLHAQDVLQGRVTDAETSRPLEAVMVSVLRDSMTIDYTLTDADGHYSLPWRHKGTLQVSASMLGYGRQTRDVGKGGRLDFALRTESIVLREVEIRPGRISSRRDTVRYNLADFITEKDTRVRDVLKRLPGIDVEENGTVTYKGKPIDHFLVEGMDVTGGRYNQVNNNLDARAVKSAELMENYQSVRALKGKIDSEQVALNLRLDEKARDQWFPYLQAGGGLTEDADGHPAPLWEGTLSALQLGRGRQSIFALKTNNTGRDLSDEQALLATNIPEAAVRPSLLDLPAFSAPLDSRRTLFNETWTTNANRMYRRDDERTLRVQADYTHDFVHQERGNRQTYYQANDTVNLSEEADYRLRTDALHAALAYEDNSPTHYLTERLELEAARNRSHASQLGQGIETSTLQARNYLDYLMNQGERTWELTSDVQLSLLPSVLTLATERDNYTQRSLHTRHTASYLRKRNGFSRRLEAGFTAEWARYRLESPAAGLVGTGDDLAAADGIDGGAGRSGIVHAVVGPVALQHGVVAAVREARGDAVEVERCLQESALEAVAPLVVVELLVVLHEGDGIVGAVRGTERSRQDVEVVERLPADVLLLVDDAELVLLLQAEEVDGPAEDVRQGDGQQGRRTAALHGHPERRLHLSDDRLRAPLGRVLPAADGQVAAEVEDDVRLGVFLVDEEARRSQAVALAEEQGVGLAATDAAHVEHAAGLLAQAVHRAGVHAMSAQDGAQALAGLHDAILQVVAVHRDAIFAHHLLHLGRVGHRHFVELAATPIGGQEEQQRSCRHHHQQGRKPYFLVTELEHFFN